MERGAPRGPEPLIRLMRRSHPDLWRHSLAVARLAGKAALFLPDRGGADRAALLMGALLHDAGKIFWPEKLFTKRFLDEPERFLIWAHPITGAELVRRRWPGAPEDVIRVVLEHHERPGGKGYPRGTEPCRAALLVAACDVLDAVTSDRAYRPALPLQQALEEIAGWAPPELLAAVEAAAIELRLEEMRAEAREKAPAGGGL